MLDNILDTHQYHRGTTANKGGRREAPKKRFNHACFLQSDFIKVIVIYEAK